MITLVSLLSAQTLPNVLFIEAVKEKVDHYVFLETQETIQSRVLTIIIGACKIANKPIQSLTLNPEQYSESIRILENYDWQVNSQFLLNLTCGTKMMALAAKDFFEKMASCECYYIPVNQRKAYSLAQQGHFLELPQVSLMQYLAAHGFTAKGFSKPEFPFRYSDEIFNKIIAAGHAGKVLDNIECPSEAGQDRFNQWISGAWFEEWLFKSFKELLRLKDDQIQMKVKLKHVHSQSLFESDNEFDVMFVKNNLLYLVEAKVYSSERINGTKTIVPLYKIASEQATLGLHARSIVAILAPLWHDLSRTKRINDLKRILKISHVWDLEDLNGYNDLIGSLARV